MAADSGEWRAMLAPLLTTAEYPEEVDVYAVVTVTTDGEIELRTNMAGGHLRQILLSVIPGADDGD